MPDQVRISAKALGELALPGFCQRCFWIKLRLRNKLPFQIFPGVFSSIDSYNKRIVHAWFDREGQAPPWLSPLGALGGYKEPPHFSKFNLLDSDTNVLLTGSPDGVLLRPDKSHVIVDYKTARYTEAQDELLPMYEVQLNAYAAIGAVHGLKPVSSLALVYMEPLTDDSAAGHPENQRPYGFAMGFHATIHNVPLQTERIPGLLAETRSIFDLREAPRCRAGCKDCALLDQMIRTVQP